jgi:hypothetical protein
LVVVMDFCWRKNNTPQSARRAFNLHPILDKSDSKDDRIRSTVCL